MSRVDWIVPPAGNDTQLLLIQSPYPGDSKFVGKPTSLLAAVSRLAAPFRPLAGYIDAQWIDVPVAARVRELCRTAPLRAVCISTSTAAVREAAAIARVIREELGRSALIVAGGPHEDDCAEKIALRVPEVDLSIGGDADYALASILNTYLGGAEEPDVFMRNLGKLRLDTAPGRFVVASGATGQMREFRGEKAPAWSFSDAPTIREPVRFNCFQAEQAIPLMLSRGCPYGLCSFCAEANVEYSHDTTFAWVRKVIEENPGAALYFQDSIMPANRAVRETLLPMLAESEVEWGCQLFLPMASRSYIESLVRSGCVYLYTGLETADPRLRRLICKPPVDEAETRERMLIASALGARWGISLMFGILRPNGDRAEDESHVAATVSLATRLKSAGVTIEGFYPNIQTVLPNTGVDRGLQNRGVSLDYYSMPRTTAFDAFEDGGVGYNFLTLPLPTMQEQQERHVLLLNDAARALQQLGKNRW